MVWVNEGGGTYRCKRDSNVAQRCRRQPGRVFKVWRRHQYREYCIVLREKHNQVLHEPQRQSMVLARLGGGNPIRLLSGANREGEGGRGYKEGGMQTRTMALYAKYNAAGSWYRKQRGPTREAAASVGATPEGGIMAHREAGSPGARHSIHTTTHELCGPAFHPPLSATSILHCIRVEIVRELWTGS